MTTMTIQPALFTEPGIGERCLHCQQFLTLPNIPTRVFRDDSHWGYTHPSCFAPYARKVLVLYPTRNFRKGN